MLSTRVPIPATYRKNNSVCRQLLRFARHCHTNNCRLLTNQLVRMLMDQVDAMQTKFVEQIARCPGSSMARKRSVFMRLQRARNLVATCANEDLDLAKLALAANYYCGHFITIFRSVFGETPYSSINRQRLASASSLLRASELAVGEIAQSSRFFKSVVVHPCDKKTPRAIGYGVSISGTETGATRELDWQRGCAFLNFEPDQISSFEIHLFRQISLGVACACATAIQRRDRLVKELLFYLKGRDISRVLDIPLSSIYRCV